MNKHLYVIGIDGGGTKTNAVLCSLDGKILSETQGGPSNFQIIGLEQTAVLILDLIQNCCRTIGCNISEIGAVVAGLAGAGRTSDQKIIFDEILKTAAQKNLNINKLIIESDARIALEGAFSGKPGIVVIAGTGSIVFGKNEKGKIFRAGGWGRIIGDEGSGYAIGREAIRAVVKCIDGYGKKTKLWNIFDYEFNLGNQEAIIEAVYRNNFALASLAPMVINAVSQRDKIAKIILKQASDDLTNVIAVVVEKINKRRSKPPKRNLALIGSLFEDDNVYSKFIKHDIKRKIKGILLRSPESPPVVGAALMAIAHLMDN